jgi:hypothetical protein
MPASIISSRIYVPIMKLKIKFAAVPKTAPLVRMARESIFVGYNQGSSIDLLY